MPVPGSVRFDRLLALGVLGLAVVIAALRDSGSLVRDALLLAVAVSPWLVKAVRPIALPTWLSALPPLVAVGLLLTDGLANQPSPLLLLILVVCVGWQAPLRESLAANLAACGLLVVAGFDVEEAFIWSVGLTLGWAFGHSSRCQEQAMQRLRQAQDTIAEQAAADERRRVAREVHDVIAHTTLAVTMLHLTGARLALAEGDQDEALRGMQDAERLGRDSLAGLRRSVGLLTTADLLRAVKTVAGGGSWLDPAVTGTVLASYRIAAEPGPPAGAAPDLLTPREQEVLVLMARGASNSELAERLFLSEGTVKTHIGRIFTKLGVRDRAGAIVWAYDTGVVRPRS